LDRFVRTRRLPRLRRRENEEKARFTVDLVGGDGVADSGWLQRIRRRRDRSRFLDVGHHGADYERYVEQRDELWARATDEQRE